MSIIKCRECGNDVSDLAEACPNCGCPISYSLAESKTLMDSEDEAAKERARENTENGKRINNTFAMAAFIIGILSVFFGTLLVLLPIFAILFSILGINRFNPSKEKNKWMSYVGLGLGLASVLLHVLAWVGIIK